MSSFSHPLRSLVVHEVVEDQRVRVAIGVVAFALLTAFGAQIAVRLPWTPVPVTLQPLFVILAGAMLGPRLGALSMAVYVAVGSLGAPVYANGGAGLPWLFGPTGGYLLAAPPAAFVTGWVARRFEGGLPLLAGLTLGVLTMYVGGVAQLMALTGRGVGAVLAIGVTPFLVGDVTKIALAFSIERSARWLRRRRS